MSSPGVARQDFGFAQSQKTRPLQPDLHEGRLHPRHHALDAAQDDVADMAVTMAGAFLAADGALEAEFLEPAMAEMRDADFPRPGIDEDFSLMGRAHDAAGHEESYHGTGKPQPLSSATVSASGSPTTLE